jgi:hypothetical protein
MNDIGELLAVMLAILAAGIIFLMMLTYFETTVVEPPRPRQRIFRKKATTGMHR